MTDAALGVPVAVARATASMGATSLGVAAAVEAAAEAMAVAAKRGRRSRALAAEYFKIYRDDEEECDTCELPVQQVLGKIAQESAQQVQVQGISGGFRNDVQRVRVQGISGDFSNEDRAVLVQGNSVHK